jgi:serine/threonine protein kinase
VNEIFSVLFWKSHDLIDLDKPVAIKVVSLATMDTSLAEQNAQSVLNEIKMSKRLARTSRHIIQMYDFDFHDTGLSLLVMELGQQDLENYLSQKSFVSSVERKGIWRQLVDMAVALHSHGVVCRSCSRSIR